jgi:hypothetical protein
MKAGSQFTDPTFLRTIVDGLNSGAINKDNASALPIGLVGIYEEALPPASSFHERKRFLDFFGVWALLMKEVSVAFVAPLLEGWSEEQVLEYINNYSKWFNSPVSGTYTLYHERFRSFLLQKISESNLIEVNNRIIAYGQSSINQKLGDEWELYSLEHLSAHLLNNALLNKEEGGSLKELAYNTAHWNRQIEISKGFDWSKKMLNEMMLWASKYDDEEVIECALNKVDLHHQEQNDAPRIVALVAQNDIETALQRIESFGGNDKEGLQRKFILYMLCLMELTLLDSKDKPFRKEAIEKLLKHLDENTADDLETLDWSRFISSELIYKICLICLSSELDVSIILKRTSDWDLKWISSDFKLTDNASLVFNLAIENQQDSLSKSKLCGKLSVSLFHAGFINEPRLYLSNGLLYLDNVSDFSVQLLTLIALIESAYTIQEIRKAEEITDLVLQGCNTIIPSLGIVTHLCQLTTILYKNGARNVIDLVKQVLLAMEGLSQDGDKAKAMNLVADVKEFMGDSAGAEKLRNDAIDLVFSNIEDLVSGVNLNAFFSNEMAVEYEHELDKVAGRAFQATKDNSALLLGIEIIEPNHIQIRDILFRAIENLRFTYYDNDRILFIDNISVKLAKVGLTAKAIGLANLQPSRYWKERTLHHVFKELIALSYNGELDSYIDELELEYVKCDLWLDISSSLSKSGNVEHALWYMARSEKLEAEIHNVITLSKIICKRAHVLFAIGKRNDSLLALDAVEKKINEIDDPATRVLIYVEVLDRLAAFNGESKSQDLFSMATESIPSISDGKQRLTMAKKIADIACLHGYSEIVQDIINKQFQYFKNSRDIDERILLLQLYANYGRNDNWNTYFQEVFNLIATCQDIQQRNLYYINLCEAGSNLMEWHELSYVVDKIETPQSQLHAVIKIASNLIKRHNDNSLLNIYRQQMHSNYAYLYLQAICSFQNTIHKTNADILKFMKLPVIQNKLLTNLTLQYVMQQHLFCPDKPFKNMNNNRVFDFSWLEGV